MSKVEVTFARDRLSGALSSAVDRFGGNEELAVHGVFGSPSKRLHSLDSPLGSPTKSPRPARRRRKKEAPPTSAFHHTFVMKLFDRSVDLAQFQDEASLYPVCRAWMKNQPSNTNMAPRMRTPTPEPDSEGEKEDAKADKNEEEAKSEEGSEEAPKEDEEVKVYKMPDHQPLTKDEQDQIQSLRIPTPTGKPDIDPDFLETAQKEDNTADNLLNEHMTRWFKVRRNWREAAAKNEERYKGSMDLLRDMFEK